MAVQCALDRLSPNDLVGGCAHPPSRCRAVRSWCLDLLAADMAKPVAAVIDIGINEVTHAYSISRIFGEAGTADIAEVESRRDYAGPRRGVGPVTVTMLIGSVAIAFEKQMGIR